MFYISTRDKSQKVTSSQAILNGISQEGGLFVPQYINKICIDKLIDKTYKERAYAVLSEFLTDFSKQQLTECIDNAYTDEKFCGGHIAPISDLQPNVYMLELWHGPTSAFKDVALQLLPQLLTSSAKNLENDKEIIILVATSGDTGKAALEGFKDINGTKIVVFYPQQGVSDVQRLQMQTQQGSNVMVCSVKGNFDDAQTAVKTIFTDEKLKQEMNKNNKIFSSANSINWGRLVPQVVYYISAYCDMVKNEEIAFGDKINIVVPTGNFGNILAAYYAKKMGLPVNKFICASNQNNVLTDFINTGEYNKNRDFYQTISPSMDILVSSNLERLLFDLCGEDDGLINKWFSDLKANGSYKVSDEVKSALQDNFYAGFCDDCDTKKTIYDIFNKYSYLIDTHTAVALKVYNDYVKKFADETKTIVASTASPYKFANSVLSSLNYENEKNPMEKLREISGLEIPKNLSNLENMPILFDTVIDKNEILDFVKKYIGVVC